MRLTWAARALDATRRVLHRAPWRHTAPVDRDALVEGHKDSLPPRMPVS
jgi:hypothetical protein